MFVRKMLVCVKVRMEKFVCTCSHAVVRKQIFVSSVFRLKKKEKVSTKEARPLMFACKYSYDLRYVFRIFATTKVLGHRNSDRTNGPYEKFAYSYSYFERVFVTGKLCRPNT